MLVHLKSHTDGCVALLAEDVDRNPAAAELEKSMTWVALLAEDVDRNCPMQQGKAAR